MKKCIVVLLVVVLAIGILPPGVSRSDAADVTFKDVPKNAWYYSHIQYIVNYPKELMVGYQGNFGPLDNLTVEQFVKIACAAAGRGVVVPKGTYWGDVYVPIGLELKIILPGEFTDYKRPITRAEMARIIIRSLPLITGESNVTYNLNDIKARMVDYDSIPDSLKDYVCRAYQLGVLSGGTDKKFNPNGSLTRASAASVIHLMLDPQARPTATTTSGMWTDAEFEAFMRSSDNTYVNVNGVGKIENRKIYWKQLDSNSQVLIPETSNPGVNDMVYSVVKILSYYTVKTKGYLRISYSAILEGGIFTAQFFSSQNMVNVEQDGDIAFWIFANPLKSLTGDKYFPGQQKGLSNYLWILGAMHTSDDIKGYKSGMDRLKYTWTAPRYEEIFEAMCEEVYGQTQGDAFYKFALNELDNFYLSPSDFSSKYIGVKNEVGAELVYHYPDDIKVIEIWSDRPGDRK